MVTKLGDTAIGLLDQALDGLVVVGEEVEAGHFKQALGRLQIVKDLVAKAREVIVLEEYAVSRITLE